MFIAFLASLLPLAFLPIKRPSLPFLLGTLPFQRRTVAAAPSPQPSLPATCHTRLPYSIHQLSLFVFLSPTLISSLPSLSRRTMTVPPSMCFLLSSSHQVLPVSHLHLAPHKQLVCVYLLHARCACLQCMQY